MGIDFGVGVKPGVGVDPGVVPGVGKRPEGILTPGLCQGGVVGLGDGVGVGVIVVSGAGVGVDSGAVIVEDASFSGAVGGGVTGASEAPVQDIVRRSMARDEKATTIFIFSLTNYHLTSISCGARS